MMWRTGRRVATGRWRAFTFLGCLGCHRFVPKRTGQDALLVGFCADEGGPEPVQWMSLERAVGDTCADREPLPPAAPSCPHFEVTAESAGRPYPHSCVHLHAAVCPLPH